MTTLTQALAVVKTAMQDPALRAMILAQLDIPVANDTTRTVPTRLPAISEITAVQTAIFDNWPQGRPVKSQPNRYGACLEIWTADADRINVARKGDYQHKVNLKLYDKAAFEAWLKRTNKENPTRKNPLGSEYLSRLADVPGCMDDGDLVGLCAVKTHGDGTVYFDDQFVIVRQTAAGWAATLFIGDEPLDLPPFDALASNGAQHGGNVVAQSRMDRVGFSSNWATFVTDNVVAFRAA